MISKTNKTTKLIRGVPVVYLGCQTKLTASNPIIQCENQLQENKGDLGERRTIAV